MKSIKIVFAALLVLNLFSCQQKERIKKIEGEAIGTYYVITLVGGDGITKHNIDSVNQILTRSVSIFDSTSLLSKINNNQEDIVDGILEDLIRSSIKVSQETGGAFDCTVGALVNLWGFGKDKKKTVDSLKVTQALEATGYQKISLNHQKIIKENSDIQLNFNAIAKGYLVDMLAKYLDSQGVENYLIDIGGEVRAQGEKQSGKPWKVGVQVPTESKTDAAQVHEMFELKNRSVATSGNYRNYYEENGQRFSHTINPKTGYPEKTNLLSVSVIADNCAYADALATAFMVMGVNQSIEFLKQRPDIGGMFIYDENGEIKTLKVNFYHNFYRPKTTCL